MGLWGPLPNGINRGYILTLQETNISLKMGNGKSSTQKCIGTGYVNSLEGNDHGLG